MKDEFEFLRGLANCEDREQIQRYIENHMLKLMTNGDRIRAMSDEELAKQLIEYRDDWGDFVTHGGSFDKREDAIRAEIEWLKQPVNE